MITSRSPLPNKELLDLLKGIMVKMEEAFLEKTERDKTCDI